jgi:hypothetical protein
VGVTPVLLVPTPVLIASKPLSIDIDMGIDMGMDTEPL